MVKKVKEVKRRRWWVFFIVAAGIITAVASFSEASNNRPLRYYSDGSGTAMTFYTNSSGDSNRSLWGINTDDPQCELDINGTICINRTGVYVYGVNLTPGSSGAPTGATYLTLSLDAGLSAERVLTAGNGITFTDTGANGVLRINLTGLQACASGNVSMWDGSQWNCVNLTTSGSSNTFGYGLNVSGGLVTVANLTACNPVTEYSVWDGTEWQCDNDGGGTDTNNYTTNISFVGRILNLARDGMVNLTASLIDDSILLNWLNITGRPTDLANFTNTPGYITSAPNINVTNFKEANSTTAQLNLSDGRVLNATLSFGTGTGNGNITGSGRANTLSYWTNTTDSSNTTIFYAKPGDNLQTILTNCGSDGCVVWLGEGSYTVSTLLALQNNTWLRGSGRNNTIFVSGNNAVLIATNANNVRISDLTIDNTNVTSLHSTIFMSNSDYCLIENVHIFEGNGDGFSISNSTGCVLRNTIAEGKGRYGYYLRTDSDENIITESQTVSNQYGILVEHGSDGNRIVNNFVHNNSLEGIYVRGDRTIVDGNTVQYNLRQGIACEGSVGNYVVEGVIIVNNVAHSNTNQGLDFEFDCDNGIVSNNVAYNNGRGLYLADGSIGNMTVIGNKFYNNTALSAINGANHTIIGNSELDTWFAERLGVNKTTRPTSTLDVSGNASFSGNVASFAGLFSNGSQVCTAANGLCTSVASGNTSSNLNTNSVPKWNGSVLINSSITDNGSNVTINAANVNISGVLNVFDIQGDGTSPRVVLSTSAGASLRYTTSNLFTAGSNRADVTGGSFVMSTRANGVMINASGVSTGATINNTLVVIGTMNVSNFNNPSATSLIVNSAGVYFNNSQLCSSNGVGCPTTGGSGGNTTSTANGTAGYIPKYSNTTNFVNSGLRDNGSHVYYNEVLMFTKNSSCFTYFSPDGSEVLNACN